MLLKTGAKGVIKFIIFLGIGLLITWLSLRGLSPEDRSDLISSFWEVNFFWIFLVLLMSLASHLLRALRWQMMLEPVATKPPLKHTFMAVMVGYLANMALPRLGEVTRCGVLLTTDKIPLNRSLGTVVTDRAIDTLVFGLLFVVLVITQYQQINAFLDDTVVTGMESKLVALAGNQYLLLGGGAALLFSVLFVIIAMRAKPDQKFLFKVKSMLTGFLNGLVSVRYVKQPWLFALYSFAIWGFYFLMTWLCFSALNDTAHLGLGAGLAVLLLGTVGIVLTPGGIGLYPVIVQETLLLFGVTATTGFAMGWILWSTQTMVILIAGLISVIGLGVIKRRARRDHDEQA
jgi:glycosyltransferase 2 family protein